MRPRRLACVLGLVALSVALLAAVLPAPPACEAPAPSAPLASSTALTTATPSSHFPHRGGTP